MRPDRFEILVCLSGVVGVALVTTAAFGMATAEPARANDQQLSMHHSAKQSFRQFDHYPAPARDYFVNVGGGAWTSPADRNRR